MEEGNKPFSALETIRSLNFDTGVDLSKRLKACPPKRLRAPRHSSM